MKKINLLNPYIYKYLWNYDTGKIFINNLINIIFEDNNKYELLPFFSEELNNVRSYVILESNNRIVFLDFNFKNNNNLIKNDLLLINYLKMTTKKVVELIIFNDYDGKTNKVGNILDIYNNDERFKYIYSKEYKEQVKLNEEITNLIYQLNEKEYEIYLHENKLKEKI